MARRIVIVVVVRATVSRSNWTSRLDVDAVGRPGAGDQDAVSQTDQLTLIYNGDLLGSPASDTVRRDVPELEETRLNACTAHYAPPLQLPACSSMRDSSAHNRSSSTGHGYSRGCHLNCGASSPHHCSPVPS
ncbi:hypothetical protein MRB53_037144 [Persea americana]|nr:hypothetical protein MRB53_037144 [Persea americana]